MACCNDAGQFFPPLLTYKGVNKKQELADSLTQAQTCTLTGRRHALIRTYSAGL